MAILFLAAAVTAVIVKIDGWVARTAWIAFMILAMALLPGTAAVVSPLVVYIALLIKDKFNDIRGSSMSQNFESEVTLNSSGWRSRFRDQKFK